jgi:retron-type reverse transcriptase
MAYKPRLVLRIYISKAGSQRKWPLGILALEDKLVQAGLTRTLQAIYEQDFIKGSHGFRLLQSCHDALRTLSQTVENQPVHYIVKADIKACFDNVEQGS